MNKHTLPNDKTGGSLTTNAGVWTKSSHTPYNNINTNNCHTLESSSNSSLITGYFQFYSPTTSLLTNIDTSRRKVEKLVRIGIDKEPSESSMPNKIGKKKRSLVNSKATVIVIKRLRVQSPVREVGDLQSHTSF